MRSNTDEWMRNNMNILKDHYDSVIALALEDLPMFERVAWDKAVAYGRERYKRRLTESSIITLSTLVEGVRPPVVEGWGVWTRESGQSCLQAKGDLTSQVPTLPLVLHTWRSIHLGNPGHLGQIVGAA